LVFLRLDLRPPESSIPGVVDSLNILSSSSIPTCDAGCLRWSPGGGILVSPGGGILVSPGGGILVSPGGALLVSPGGALLYSFAI